MLIVRIYENRHQCIYKNDRFLGTVGIIHIIGVIEGVKGRAIALTEKLAKLHRVWDCFRKYKEENGGYRKTIKIYLQN
jgi:pyruvate formate-lyase activating enzyme-like uncharacterized protein